MAEHLTVLEPMRLVEFLRTALPGWKRSTLEQRVRAGAVTVNGTVVRRNDPVAAGDVVEVAGHVAVEKPAPAGIVVLHEDDLLVAISKPAGLLSVSTEAEREETALARLREHLSRPGRPARLWPVHRLDRETSGILLFARTREAQEMVQARWSEARKSYLAWCDGIPQPAEGAIDQPLWEDGALFVHVGEREGAREARTFYRTLEVRGPRALLELELDTGRRHQIRAHLAWLGCPIVGDPRYGKPGKRMALHAFRLELPHPGTGELVRFEAPPPPAFDRA